VSVAKMSDNLRSVVKRSTAVAFVAAALAMVGACSSNTTTTKASRPKPTPTQNAVGATFSGCGAATYTEPTPPPPAVTSSSSLNPHPSTARPPVWTPPPPTDNDILYYVHQILTHDPSVSHKTVTCGIKHFAASDLADYLHGTAVKGDVVVVAAHVQPAGSGIGQDRVILLTSSRPLAIYIIDNYSSDLVPDIFKGI
jgi:hypothetical protein